MAVWLRSTRSGCFGSAKPAPLSFKPAPLSFALLSSAVALSGTASHAQERAGPPSSDLTVSAGASAWSGHFGAPTNTEIWSALLGARYRIGGLRLSASVPRMQIRSDGTFFAGLGGTPLFVAPNIRPVKRVRNGWGDLTLGASYLLPGGDRRGFDLELTGRVKIPTASKTSQLSTGKTDYSGGVELSRSFGRLVPAVSATYRVFGDTGPWQFHNGFDVTAGASYLLTSRTTALLTYEYAEASNRFISDSHEILAGLSTPLIDRKLRLSGYASKGLSDGASNVSAGASLSFTL